MKKRLKLEKLSGGESWRTGLREESQVGQVFFYLLAVQLGNIKARRQPQQILGVHVEGDEVYIYFIFYFLFYYIYIYIYCIYRYY